MRVMGTCGLMDSRGAVRVGGRETGASEGNGTWKLSDG